MEETVVSYIKCVDINLRDKSLTIFDTYLLYRTRRARESAKKKRSIRVSSRRRPVFGSSRRALTLRTPPSFIHRDTMILCIIETGR